MDCCSIDITVEFLAVAFHSILYYFSVYPKSVFETRKKYNVIVYHSIHPEVNEYIDLCLKSIKECLNIGQLSRVDFVVTNNNYKPLVQFVFELGKNEQFNEIMDAYLVQTEQNFRAFCLKMSTITNKVKDLPEDLSFSISLHTKESTCIALATNSDLENFPFVELDQKVEETNEILPIRRFSVRNFYLDTYVEIKQ